MIAYGLLVGDEENYRRYFRPGFERAAGPDDELIELRGRDCIFAGYNEILDRVRRREDLEALVLIHEDAEIHDPDFSRSVAVQCAAPGVGIVGAVGGRGVGGLAWWESSEHIANYRWRALSEREELRSAEPELGMLQRSLAGGRAVDSVDGYVMALSPAAVATLRFDERTYGPGFHGYDIDICFEARARGLRVVVGDLDVSHHHTGVLTEREPWLQAHIAFARKWEGRMPPPAGLRPLGGAAVAAAGAAAASAGDAPSDASDG